MRVDVKERRAAAAAAGTGDLGRGRYVDVGLFMGDERVES